MSLSSLASVLPKKADCTVGLCSSKPPFSGSGTFHMLIQVLVGGGAQLFFLCLFSIYIFKGTGLLLA